MLIKEFALANFSSNDVLNFALNVEKVTTAKVQCVNYNNICDVCDVISEQLYGKSPDYFND